MSIKTWKAEFYSRPLKKFTKVQAIEHSLRKWIGLRLENREKHGLVPKHNTFLYDEKYDSFNIDSESCSLCVKYLEEWDGDYSVSRCEKCPLYLTLGMACDSRPNKESPYHSYVFNQDPEPMIAALQKCLEENKSG